MSDNPAEAATTQITSVPGLGGETVVATTGGVQRKVSFASVAAYLSGLALASVVQSLQNGSLIAALPPVASAILAPVVPALLVLITGYMTTNRLDPNAVKGLVAAAQAQLGELVERRVQKAITQRLGGDPQ